MIVTMLVLILRIHEEFKSLKLSDLRIIATLGVGGFGRVELVMIAGDNKQRSFALKQMKKSQIVETRQQQHIMSGAAQFQHFSFECRTYITYNANVTGISYPKHLFFCFLHIMSERDPESLKLSAPISRKFF